MAEGRALDRDVQSPSRAGLSRMRANGGARRSPHSSRRRAKSTLCASPRSAFPTSARPSASSPRTERRSGPARSARRARQRAAESFGAKPGADRLYEISGKPLDITPCLFRMPWLHEVEPTVMASGERMAEAHGEPHLQADRRNGRPCRLRADARGAIDMKQRSWSEGNPGRSRRRSRDDAAPGGAGRPKRARPWEGARAPRPACSVGHPGDRRRRRRTMRGHRRRCVPPIIRAEHDVNLGTALAPGAMGETTPTIAPPHRDCGRG